MNDPPEFTLSSNEFTADEDSGFGVQQIFSNPVNTPSNEEDQVPTYSIEPPTVEFVQMSFSFQEGTLTFMPITDGWGSQNFTITADG